LRFNYNLLFKAKYNDALNRANAAEAELKTLKPENLLLKKKLADAKANLEDETVKRVDLQNKVRHSHQGIE